MPMSLNQLFPQAERDLLIRELTLDSRGVRPGDLFLAVPGGRQDGRAHIADALAKGVVVDRHARGQGVGRELIGRAVERARSWGCYKLALSSHQDRETAQRFYAALGFTSHGVSLALHLG